VRARLPDFAANGGGAARFFDFDRSDFFGICLSLEISAIRRDRDISGGFSGTPQAADDECGESCYSGTRHNAR
jgi:hypothetical protein